MAVTAFYAGLLAPLFVVLSGRVIALRRGAQAAFGDGGDQRLLRRIRVQANFAEYAPIGLILLGCAESLHATAWLLHILGLTLLAGRAAHAFGVSRSPENFRLRVAGMVLTLTMIVGASAVCLVLSILQGT